jgi:hypothetical protein
MWFPEWLYKRLPFFYLAAGGICLWLFGVSSSILLSVALLVCAALLTLSWRRTARQAAAIRARRRRPQVALAVLRQSSCAKASGSRDA